MATNPPGAGLFTTIHFVALALLAVATVVAILVGVRRRRQRLEAERRTLADAKEAGVAEAPPEEPSAEPAPVAAPPESVEPASTPPPPSPPTTAPVATDAASPADGPVTQLKGLGPKVAARLAELGITTVGHVAALDADQAAALDARMGPFTGRLHRDRWVEQARFLASGDRSGFEAVFGRL